MGVAAHLGIRIDEYDARIRTFIPDYEEMLDAAAAAIPPGSRMIVDLGTGTGALAARCLGQAPGSRLTGIDIDAQMLGLAAQRLDSRATLVRESFLRARIPTCHAVVASFALHHVRTRAAKARLYRRIRASLVEGGRCIIVDCHPASTRMIARGQFAAWEAHLQETYTRAQARKLLAAWADEDIYVPLGVEAGLIDHAGLRVELLWRRGAFAVIAGVLRS
jgi:SAM-dependent methyltransferase